MTEVELRELSREDAERIAFLGNDIRIAENLRDRFPHPYRIEDAKEFLHYVVKHQNPKENFGIYYKNELVGIIGIHPFQDIYRHSAEIGYWLGVEYWGQGIMSRAVPLILEYGFKTLELHRIQAGVIGYNESSKKVLEKCGMQLEGIHRGRAFKKGGHHDEYMYAILKQQYDQP